MNNPLGVFQVSSSFSESQEVKASKAAASTKIFVARLTENVSESDLRDHFEKFGDVTDIYIPKPFRSFAFVSFLESRYCLNF